MTKKAFLPVLMFTAVLMLIPLAAMNFTDEFNWGIGDFVIAAALFLSTGFTIQLLRTRAMKAKTKTLLIALVLITLVLLWAELAVGIFQSFSAGD